MPAHPSRLAGHRAPLLALAAAAALVGAPRPAAAQTFVERIVLRTEVGAGTMLAGYQRDALGYALDVQASGRLGFTLFGPVALQASFSNWWFPSSEAAGGLPDGRQYSVTGGLRIEPMIGGAGRLFLDGNAGLGVTGGEDRLAVDAGLGFEFALGRAVGLGPVARYGHLFAATDAQDHPSDAQYWSAGLSLSVRMPRGTEERGPLDADRDGVLDADDECPAEPAGAAPDAQHRGCPTRDRDRDGVADPADLCPEVAAGDHPDPTRLGCPASDGDGDGVYDHEDRCATTPAGPSPDPERPGCPDADTDTDGVLDHADQCRTEPQGLHPDPARPGCALPDRDHDTVPDATDACPDVVGAPSPVARRNGCPGLVVVRGGMIVILQPVFFATNRDRILAPSFRVLTAVVAALRAQPEIRRVGVEGHTDNVGGDEANLALSQRRAQSVVAWLVAHGVEPGRVEGRGYGAARPLVPNDSASGRAANRRVEFHILDPQPAVAADANGSASGPAAPTPSP
ncbi:MAG: OmpA family protein [Deltaproteobacteria bacterium]|nr:OmpA family protein [Rhodocyclaceae bacterium]MDP3215929.1 OmpA family protein [Deltaproteobacteria bacterium]